MDYTDEEAGGGDGVPEEGVTERSWELVKTKESKVPAETAADEEIEYDSSNYEDGAGVSGSTTNRFDAGRDGRLHGNPNNSTTMVVQLNEESDQVEKGDYYDSEAFNANTPATTTTTANALEVEIGLSVLQEDSAKTVKSRRRRNNHHHHRYNNHEEAGAVDDERTTQQLMARERDSGEYYTESVQFSCKVLRKHL